MNLDQLLADDVPMFDLTTHWLGIGTSPARLVYTTRQTGVVSGLDAVRQLALAQGVRIVEIRSDGAVVQAGEALLILEGSAQALHFLWKTGLNLLEFCSGVATRTRQLVDLIKPVNPSCGVFTTRKMIPGSRPWAIKAVLDGGGMPHRLGLSETILIFDQHKAFFPNPVDLIQYIQKHRHQVIEKKVLVEVSTLDEARPFAEVGVDGLQFDKVNSGDLLGWVPALRKSGYSGIIIATGGITANNVADYAASGVDGVATSWVYHGPGMDIGASIEPNNSFGSIEAIVMSLHHEKNPQSSSIDSL